MYEYNADISILYDEKGVVFPLKEYPFPHLFMVNWKKNIQNYLCVAARLNCLLVRLCDRDSELAVCTIRSALLLFSPVCLFVDVLVSCHRMVCHFGLLEVIHFRFIQV